MIPEQQATKTDVRKPVILTVDDDPNNLAVVRDSLAECNYTILVAEDGESALKRANYAQPDLILLDIMMPGIDGYETCRRLKNNEGTKDIPVIFMTALVETGHKVKGLEVGAVDYITKPFHREELLARISVHLHIKELTNRLKEAKESLEKRVEERTAELACAICDLQAEIRERELAEAERGRLATAIEQAAEAIFITDDKWIIDYVNPAFERLSNYDRDEIIGQHTRVLKNDNLDPSIYKQIITALTHGDVWSGRLTIKKKDGSHYNAEVTASPIRDKDGNIINYVSIHRDITHEMKLERELRQAQKMEAIGTLAGGIAHDFNNILMALMGFAEMAMQKTPDESPISRDLERVIESGMRATELVQQILTFSRQNELERKPVHLAPIVKEVLRLFRSSFPATIELRQVIDITHQNDVVLADSTQLHQVLMNLGINAAHAMRLNGGILNISLSDIQMDEAFASRYHGLNPGKFVKLTVSDTGQGIDSAIIERIFDPYFTTKGIGEGTGMGLAVVQGIVTNLGGAITVNSEPGQGTTFDVYIPRTEEEVALGSGLIGQPITGNERVLFVDDENAITDLGGKMLRSLGYDVTLKTSSIEALETFRARPYAFDLVITDMTMPGLTGKELARNLLEIRPDIPIVICTGFSEQIDGKEAREIGIRDFLMKPYVISKLGKSIRKVLSGMPA